VPGKRRRPRRERGKPGRRVLPPWPVIYLVLLGAAMLTRPMPDPVAGAEDGDAKTYVYLANKLASDHRYEEAWPAGSEFRAWRPPVYPLFLAAFAAAGRSAAYPVAFQIVIFLVSGWLLYRLTRELFDARTAGIALVLFTLNPTLFHFAYVFMSETLFNFLALACAVSFVWFLASQRTVSALLTSLCLGLAVLTRTLAIPVVLGLGVAAAVIWGVRRLRPGTRPRLRLTPVSLAALVLPGLLLVSAWTYRNYRETGGFVLVATSNALNLYFGSLESYDWRQEHDRVINPLRARYGEIGSTRELDRMAWRNAVRDPAAYGLRKVSDAWAYFRKLDPRRAPDTAVAGVLAVLFGIGLATVVIGRDMRGLAILLTHLLILASVCLAYYKGRFIIPLIPFHVIIAAVGAHTGFRTVRRLAGG
jgi:4-amino-4-deoxy-L-arabinose transferase-like glycosyltransferase